MIPTPPLRTPFTVVGLQVFLLTILAGCCSHGIPSARGASVIPDSLWRDLVANQSGADLKIEVRRDEGRAIGDGWLRIVTAASHLAPDTSETIRAEDHEAGPFDMSLPGSRRLIILARGMKLQTRSVQGARLHIAVRPVE